jgi:quercetin dioxygenase-like cupin family protein
LLTVSCTTRGRTPSPTPSVIAKNSGLRVVLIALKPGGWMDEHRTDRSITVQGVDGHIEFTIGDTVTALTPSRLLAVAPGFPHRVAGIDESAFLLTIGCAHDTKI